MPPAQFEQLLDKALWAAAEHLQAGFEAEGVLHARDEAIDTLPATDMQASVNPGAVHVLTRIHIGVLALNFSCPRQTVLDYCHQVLHSIHEADSQPPSPLM